MVRLALVREAGSRSTSTHLMTWLESQAVTYRLIEHAPEGRAELVSQMCGNAFPAAARIAEL